MESASSSARGPASDGDEMNWDFCDHIDVAGSEAPPSGAGTAARRGDEDEDAASVVSAGSARSEAMSYEAISPSCSWQDGLDEAAAAASADTRALLARFFTGPTVAAGDAGTQAALPPAPAAGGAERVTVRLAPACGDGEAAGGPLRLVLSVGGATDHPACKGPPSSCKQPAAADACGAGAAAADPPQPPASPPRKGLGASAHLRVLNWLVPGVAFLVIGHLASHAAAPSAPGPGAGSGPAWGLHRAGAAFGTIGAGGGPVVVSACGAPGGGGEAVQLVFANYRACAGAGGRGGCGASDWSTSSGWSDGYSA